jgi:hypothetical protein
MSKRQRSIIRDAAKELAAAAALKDQLQKLFGEDDDMTLLRDSIEGSTDLFEMSDKLLEQMLHDREMIEGIKAVAAKRAARQKRLEDREKLCKSMLLNLLEILEQPRIERPIALVFTRTVPAKAEVTDEAKIPSQFWRTPEPELDLKALLDGLKANREHLSAAETEFTTEIAAGRMTAENAAFMLELAAVRFSIPGAELSQESVGVTVKWS